MRIVHMRYMLFTRLRLGLSPGAGKSCTGLWTRSFFFVSQGQSWELYVDEDMSKLMGRNTKGCEPDLPDCIIVTSTVHRKPVRQGQR